MPGVTSMGFISQELTIAVGKLIWLGWARTITLMFPIMITKGTYGITREWAPISYLQVIITVTLPY